MKGLEEDFMREGGVEVVTNLFNNEVFITRARARTHPHHVDAHAHRANGGIIHTKVKPSKVW